MNSLKEFKLKDMSLKNKLVMPPMCMYSANNEGYVNDFHKVHYTSRALGGVGLIILEATAVEPRGRISDNDLGIWDEKHIPGLGNLVELGHKYGANMGIQLAHAGRKCRAETEFTVAPSSISFNEEYRVPKELTKEEIRSIIDKFKRAAKRADEAGFDLIEIHAAHGYLIHEFLSPLSNKRTDAYGGSLENRVRFLKEILTEVKKVWPSNKPISLRVSATDYLEGGIDGEEIVRIVNLVKTFIDIVHVSTGGLLPAKIKLYDGYQVQYAEKIKRESGLPTIAVGLIQDFEMIEDIVDRKKADLVALGRKLLREPQFIINKIYEARYEYEFPETYKDAYRYRSFDKLKKL